MLQSREGSYVGERVMVTGGAGFIGSHLVDALIARGAQVHVIDDLSTGQRERVHPDATLHVADVSDPAALDEIAASAGPISCWYHLAAQANVRVSVEQPTLDARVNVVGTVAVLAAARRDAAPVVFTSTGGAIYGEAPEPASEQHPEHPESPYGAAKLAGEVYLAQDAQLNGANHVVLRLANVYGPRQDPHGEAGVVAIFGARVLAGEPATIFGTGEQTRDYVYVDDVITTCLAAADAAASGQDAHLRRSNGAVPVWNVGTGTATSVLQLWSLMEQAGGSAPGYELRPPRTGEILHSVIDANQARRELGVTIDTPLDAGLVQTLSWMRGGTAR